ncbi:MAG: ion transporter [Alphaproteobacteria bacterium]|nr:ion transporter [Alphaproteobacteria bacterium]
MGETRSFRPAALRERLYQALSHDTETGSRLSNTNRLLVIVIVSSVFVAVLESEDLLSQPYGDLFWLLELCFGTIFAVEYIIRLWVCPENPKYGSGIKGRIRYALTPTALFDLIAVLPLFLTVLGSETYLFRLLRITRILRLAKLGKYSHAARAIGEAIRSRSHELVLSLGAGMVLMLVAATCLYIAENRVQPDAFGSIPRAMWWAIATLTTVGYGDTYPITVLGKICAGVTAIIGIGLVAMPAGILAAAFSDGLSKRRGD